MAIAQFVSCPVNYGATQGKIVESLFSFTFVSAFKYDSYAF